MSVTAKTRRSVQSKRKSRLNPHPHFAGQHRFDYSLSLTPKPKYPFFLSLILPLRPHPSHTMPISTPLRLGLTGCFYRKKIKIWGFLFGLGFNLFSGNLVLLSLSLKVKVWLNEWAAMRKSFKDSLKALEADIQHANTLYASLFCLLSVFCAVKFDLLIFFFFFWVYLFMR